MIYDVTINGMAIKGDADKIFQFLKLGNVFTEATSINEYKTKLIQRLKDVHGLTVDFNNDAEILSALNALKILRLN